MTLARPVTIGVDGAAVHGDLVVPDGSTAVVVFAHGSGSGRHSPRNRQVAQRLQQEGLGTLLLDLLTKAEEGIDARTAELRFDIDLLAGRLAAAATFLDQDGDLGGRMGLGYFGASTGAAAALVAAAAQGGRVGAVVSRGGRPDLAGDALPRVQAPTLLIVGGRDEVVLDMNRGAQARLRCEHRLDIVPGATHLFGEPGALEQVADLAAGWFTRHLAGAPNAHGGRER
ncbi:MAG TPA: dienelactone hydrolase family protein [Acidimicrobiales bacterium]|nr:dienelactone hydrolase family protein [Acidimicrobiales bacterium]